MTLADLPPAVAAYVRRPGDSTWCVLTLDVLRIEDGLMTEIVTFMPHNFPSFGLPMMMDAAAGDEQMSLIYSNKRNVPQFCDEWDGSTSGCLYSLRE